MEHFFERYVMRQIVKPDTSVKALAGDCHRFAREVFGAPRVPGLDSAWKAWNAAPGRHPGELPPKGVAVPLWFSHYGTYGDPPTYGNWGHVIVQLTTGAFISSPGSGYGSERFKTIAEVERYFNATYMGWSEGINGVRVVAPDGKGKPKMYISGWYSTSTRKKPMQVIAARSKTAIHIRDDGDISLKTGHEDKDKLLAGMVDLHANIRFTGDPGTTFEIVAERGVHDAKKSTWSPKSALEVVRGTIDGTGDMAIQVAVANDIPKGQRLRFYMTVSKPVTVTFIKWKGYQW